MKKQDYEIAIENVLSGPASAERKTQRLTRMIDDTRRHRARIDANEGAVYSPGERARLIRACDEAINAAESAITGLK